jgi:hypothetical protein
VRRKQLLAPQYTCLGCGKLITDHHYAGWPKESTPPEMIHQVRGSSLPHWAIYHHCGHFTIYNLPDGWPITGPVTDPRNDVL